MALPTMYGSYPLTADGVNNAVTATAPGVYMLGKIENGTFYVGYVGRSDTDVNDRLQDHVKLSDSHFQFAYCASAEAAFYAECELFHAYCRSRNPNHPARPEGTFLRCPNQSCPV